MFRGLYSRVKAFLYIFLIRRWWCSIFPQKWPQRRLSMSASWFERTFTHTNKTSNLDTMCAFGRGYSGFNGILNVCNIVFFEAHVWLKFEASIGINLPFIEMRQNHWKVVSSKIKFNSNLKSPSSSFGANNYIWYPLVREQTLEHLTFDRYTILPLSSPRFPKRSLTNALANLLNWSNFGTFVGK